MQTIQLKKFGTVLVSRPAGLEAFNAIRPSLDLNSPVEIDFDNVLTITPSWLDEFLTQLTKYLGDKVILRSTQNASVLASLPVLSESRDDLVAKVIKNSSLLPQK